MGRQPHKYHIDSDISNGCGQAHLDILKVLKMKTCIA